MFTKSISTKLMRECFMTFVLNHGSLLFGMGQSFPACLIPQLKKEAYDINTLVESILGSISVLVIGLSTFVSMFFIGKMGRKTITQVSLLIYITGTLVLLFSTNTITLIIGLGIQSSTLSIFPAVNTIYLSEVSQKQHRGTLLSTIYVCATIGLSLNYVLLSYVSWRTMAIAGLAIAASEFAQTFLIVESGFWYLLRAQTKLAQRSITWFEPNVADDELDRRVRSIREAIDAAGPAKGGGHLWTALRGAGANNVVRPMLVGGLINVFRGGNGRSIICVYVGTVLEAIGCPPHDVPAQIRRFGWAFIAGAFVVLLVVHRLKRKTVILAASASLVATLGAMIACKMAHAAGIPLPAWLPVASLYVYAMCVATTYNAVITIIISEMQAPLYRAHISLFQNGITFVSCSAYCFAFPYAVKFLPFHFVLMVFVSNILICLSLIWFFVPETSKLEFYENEEMSSTKNRDHVETSSR